jgi:c-di-GMP-related signal transduction protein
MSGARQGSGFRCVTASLGGGGHALWNSAALLAVSKKRSARSLEFSWHSADLNCVPTKQRLTASPAQPGPKATRFIARQPIFNRDQAVYGYELLYRDSLQNCFTSSDKEAACRDTLDSTLLMGLDVLCSGGYTFINCTREALLQGYVTLLPPQSTVVEVLETVMPDPEVFSACRSLKDAGYLLALDDFVPDDPRESLTEISDLIKLDLKATSRKYWEPMARRYSSRSIRMLAEKIETHEQFFATRDMGFLYFQGYFFQTPVIYTTSEIPHTQLNYLRMLQVVYQPELDWNVLEKLIKHEASLCYRLLRYLNSACFGFKREIRTIRHALSMLGEREIRKWITLVATVGAARDKPDELVRSALVRGHFCELLSRHSRERESDHFLLGLLSLMDAILGMPMAEILARVPIDREIRQALLGMPSRLRPLHQLVLAQENADWPKCGELAAQLCLSEADIAQAYLESIGWAREVVSLQ